MSENEFWTDENVALLKKARAKGRKPGEIVRYTFHYAIRWQEVALKIALQEGTKVPSKIFWNDENVAKLKQACADGKTAGEIAAHTFDGAITRNAVIGKRTRLRIRDDAATARKKLCREQSGRKVTKRRRSSTPKIRPAVQSPAELPPQVQPPEVQPPASTFNCSIVYLTDKRCHTPIGEPRELRYCGAPVERGRFCAWCSSRLYDVKRGRNVREPTTRSVREYKTGWDRWSEAA